MSVLRKLSRWIAPLGQHWFLTALFVLLIVGFFAAPFLKPITESRWLRDGVVLAVMFCTGLTLPLAAVGRAVSRPLAVILAITINIVGVPILAILVGGLIAPEWLPGLVVASLMPCTLASAAVWTRKAGGDDSIALITTVITNLACWVVIPLGLACASQLSTWFPLAASFRLEGQAGPINVMDQMAKLGLLVVAPLIVAQLVRWRGGDRFASKHRTVLSVLAQVGVLWMVLVGSTASASQLHGFGGLNVSLMVSGVALVAATSIVHLLALGLGVGASRWSGRPRESQIAVGISGSQKTLMIGLQTAIDCGVSVIPMIVYHVGQLIWDTLIAQRWSK